MKTLKEQDYIDAAKSLGVDVASVKAIKEVESRGNGFLPSGLPVILFERHKMYHFLREKGLPIVISDVVDPDAGGYYGGEAEHQRLTKAVMIDRDSALKSTSFGLFQIMGFNYMRCGFDTLQSFINAMFKDEASHLKAFVAFVKSDKNLHTALINKDWDLVARLYNGKAYKKNSYHIKLKKAHAKWSAVK